MLFRSLLLTPGSNAGGFFMAAYDDAASVLMPEGCVGTHGPDRVFGAAVWDLHPVTVPCQAVLR